MTAPNRLLQTHDGPEYVKSLKDTGIPAHQAEAIAAGVENVSNDTNNYYAAMLQIWQGHQDQLDEIKTTLGTHQEQLDEIKTTLGSHQEQLDEIKTRLGAVETDVGVIKAVLQAQYPDAYRQATGE